MVKFYGSYEGLDDRRKQERSDSEMMGKMVSSSHANMPQDTIIKPYPKANGNMPESLDDTISGVDSQIGADNSKKNSKLKPKKV